MTSTDHPDPIAPPQVMERVRKPDGAIRPVEHRRSDVEAIAKYQKWRGDARYEKTECCRTQEPSDVIAEAALKVHDVITRPFGEIITFEMTQTGVTNHDGIIY